MGLINVLKGMKSERETYNFNGSLKENIDLNWEYAKIYSGSKELSPDYEVKEDDIILIREYPGASVAISTWIMLGVTVLVGIGTGIYASVQVKKAKKDMEDALERMKNAQKNNGVTSIPWLSGARNERADGKNAPVILGRHLFAPYFLSAPYMKPDGKDGEDLYFWGTFICGQDGLCFEKIRNGLIELATLSGNEPQTGRIPFTDPGGDAPFFTPYNYIEISQKGQNFLDSIFNQKWVDSLDSTVELEREKAEETVLLPNGIQVQDLGEKEVIRESARFPMLVEVELFVDGLYGWDSNNNVPTNATVKVALDWGLDGVDFPNEIDIQWGSEIYVPADETIYPSTTSGDNLIAALRAKFNTTGDIFNLPRGGYVGDVYITRIEIVTGNYGAQTIHFFNGTASKWTASLGYYQIVREVRIVNYPAYSYPQTGGDTLVRNSQKQMRFMATVDLSSHFSSVYSDEGKPIFIRARRMNEMHVGGYKDRVYLSAIRTKQYNPKESKAQGQFVEAVNINPVLKDKFCFMGIKLKAKENTQELLDRFNIIASMTARTWDGAQWSGTKTKTSNPAAVTLEVLSGLNHSLSQYTFNNDINQSEINGYSFGKLYEFCNSQKVQIDGSVSPEDCFLEANGVVTSSIKKIDILSSILSVCDAGIYIDEFGMVNAAWDAPQSTPLALINPQRIIKMSETRSLDRKADGYKIEFVDEDADWSTDTRRVLRPGFAENPGQNTYTPIKLEFITSYKHAMWMARKMLAKEILRPGETIVTVGKEGRFYKPGSLIKVQHERFKIGLGSGEITEVILNEAKDEIIGFKLMEKFDIADSRDYFIEYYVVDIDRNKVIDPKPLSYGSPDPQFQTLKLKSGLGYTDTLFLTAPIPISSQQDKDLYVPERGNILNVIAGDEPTTEYRIYESKRYIVSSLSENEDGFDLALVNYDPAIYETGEIPPYVSRIQNSPPRVYDSLGSKPIDGGGGQGLVDQPMVNDLVNNRINHTVPEIVTSKTPQYRGSFTSRGTNDGTINGIRMNVGDWVAYTGISGVWIRYDCYKWLGEVRGWVWLDPNFSENTSYYMAALRDITAGAQSGVFSGIMAAKIMALDAAIDELRTKYIELTSNGEIRSAGFTGRDGTTPGFWLKASNGEIQANNIKTKGMDAVSMNATNGVYSGKVYASDGEFTGKVTATSGSFTGSINATSLIADFGVTIGSILFLNDAIIAGGIRIRGTFTGAQLQAELSSRGTYAGSPGIERFHVCGGSIYRLSINQGMNNDASLFLIICEVSYHPPTNTWIIKGQETNGNFGEINLITFSARTFNVNLRYC